MDRRAKFGYRARRNSVVAPGDDDASPGAKFGSIRSVHRFRRLNSFRLNSFRQGQDVQVLVRDNNVDQALRALKKKLQREGVFREMKLRDHYEKPSEKRTREKAEAVRRARKVARKRAQRDGLLPVKPKPVR
jgi:small subunit ribosomal protein S21